MASTSSAPARYEYEVFLSLDTRHSFTDHLYEALHQAGIRTFRDEDEIRDGQELKPEIERSIIESRASVIVFSENFAVSTWCLDELWLILEQKRKGDHFVLPVFYGVDPSDVRNQRGSFTVESRIGSKWTEDNVNRWKAALREVANLKGMVVSGSETAFIAEIVHKVYHELDLKLLCSPPNLTGIEIRARDINSWLRYEQPGFPVLAICGMGGSGKTTLVKHIYNTNKQHFESSSFLEEIEDKPGVLLGLQKQLLRDVLGTNIVISNVSEGTLQIERAIERKRVLIVVDDIDDSDILSTLFGAKVLDTQSKIIITTRLLNIDTWFESISWRCRVYKLELLNPDESLELLSWHAFGSKIPMEGFEKIAAELAQYCGGNPLALKVLGSSLFVSVENPWTKSNMIEIWRSRMDSLNSLKGDLDAKIQGVLQRSFESLACHSHKELFLHIASFFVGEYAFDVEKILENDYHAKSGIMTLVNRCLVTVSRDFGKLMMHNLLQDLARNIVREESKDPAKRSRVWQCDESYCLLSKGDGSKTIEGLVLDMPKAKQAMTSETFKTSSLVKMKNLKLLQLRDVKLTGSYENFPNLRLLKWHGCNLKTIPPGLLMSSLVALDMRNGDLEKFEPPMVLHSLKVLRLSWSYKLVSIYNLHRLPKLEALDLGSCISLTHVCKTIKDLENLSFLRLSGCTRLWKASSNQKCVNQLKRLKTLCICSGTPKQPLCSLPESLSTLILSSSSFEILPNHIDLRMLQTLYLSWCPNLKSLSCLPITLKGLHVDWCTSLENITFQSARFTLQEFCYEGCFKLFEIEGLFKLVSIAEVDEADLEHMQWIKLYQNHKVDLVGDVITKGRTFNIQMLYEYGIRSTYLQSIEDQSMAQHEYTSSSNFLSLCVPLRPKKNRIQGLSVTILCGSLSSDEDGRIMLPPFAKISNRAKGITWVYNPVVFCLPRVDRDVVWLSYWPIGNLLDVGDIVHVTVFLDERMFIVRECGASLVYMDDGEVEKDEKCAERMKGEEVIGGDLSLFQVTKGAYYLCRRDFYKSETP
ncbi:putative TIR domain, P-loop containing nucleoside triphosphate hydrolase [Helianthus annuus]|uniref:TIR domain, P-loop containing nucleoside triphosphate hydrolase n=2 Tax=Helianthus annuus TaxID=4232 RepID=A0A9K3JD73_HELAN|nr:disease resistance protein RPV1 isoform X1 [Helianthus annuus]XP_022027476.1 disease resistance protein RPV1 isoform X1 [Helianthus annuus]XP_035843344.1 disease resistance protein RPV1 isoform X1 [Helianthus annuus]KAF5812943.1 putative TIR domain, P-loop containing nucleoside triphosphate hydrolase [Helianthus annuus]